MRWVDALKIFNSEKGSWCIPKKGSSDHTRVIEIMNSNKSTAKPKKKIETPPTAVASSKMKVKEMSPEKMAKLGMTYSGKTLYGIRQVRKMTPSTVPSAIEKLRGVEAETKARNEKRKADAIEAVAKKEKKVIPEENIKIPALRKNALKITSLEMIKKIYKQVVGKELTLEIQARLWDSKGDKDLYVYGRKHLNSFKK
jgi:hypothetical protein